MWLFRPGIFFFERLPHNADLLTSITEAFRQNRGYTGFFNAIGAVSRSRIAFYDQEKKEYGESSIDSPAEILSCVGNVSEADGEIFVHAHITLGYDDSSTRGGHLLDGTIIFACELFGVVLEGTPPARRFDEVTGLRLWDPSKR